MDALNRREMLGALGTLAAAGGWIGLTGNESVAGEPNSTPPLSQPPAGPAAYALPPLGYAFDALEPHIDAQTMELHHDKHHAAYVTGLNAALEQLAACRQKGDYAAVRAQTDLLAFNGAGHILHTVFWKNMKKGGGGEPKGSLATQLDRDFGNFNNFKAQFNQASATVQGGGWGILAWEPLGQRLLTLGAEKHQNYTIWGAVPLLVLDVWEHAYYLKYQNLRTKYVEAFWNVIDWDNVAERLNMAMRLSK